MGIFEVLTLIFIVLKLFGVIAWSWWLVLLPEIIGLILYLIVGIGITITGKKISKKMED
ncbi:hypothetical protein [Clostridium perfringens]|uniref:hypothetical protein n=1 Tax=Clostridium perfringens TaxID=1502 RepID=UPI0024BC987F|nr:hypothetical protein [Clostridium perfringens]MDK0745833.1 hypothetical protein [Clostridium perfringens]MDK0754919.1 hypothetical protein [Clostridium perfringens]MDK0755050.1 hypothetical protein [Clostridium perfringens]